MTTSKAIGTGGDAIGRKCRNINEVVRRRGNIFTAVKMLFSYHLPIYRMRSSTRPAHSTSWIKYWHENFCEEIVVTEIVVAQATLILMIQVVYMHVGEYVQWLW